MLHEIISGDRLAELSEFWQDYDGSSHTTSRELGRSPASRGPACWCSATSFIGATGEKIVAEATRSYDGEVVLAEDLDVY